MIKTYNINPFVEAMLYYSGRANNNRIRKRAADSIQRCPANKNALERITKPILELENLLDSKLEINDKLIDKYFKRFDCLIPSSPFGFCIASIMAFYPILSHIESSADEICRYLRECTYKERIYSLCFGLTNKYETIPGEINSADDFSRCLDKIIISSDDKLKILNAAFTYHTHLEELLSLIIPAAEIIENSKDVYRSVIDEFYGNYSVTNAQALLKSCFLHTKIDFTSFKSIKIAPMLFGFDIGFGDSDSADNVCAGEAANSSFASGTGRIFIGAARHIVKRSSENEISALSKKMKALSDNLRLEMLFYLCSNRVYGQELCAKFGLTQSTVSYHITKLFSAGLVKAEIVGSQTYYSSDKQEIQKMIDIFAKKIR